MTSTRIRLPRRPAHFAAGLLLVAAAPATASWAIDPPRADEPPRGVILTNAEAETMEGFSDCWLVAEEPHPETFKGWEPGPAEIAHLEALLPAFLRSRKTPPDVQPLHEYYRRYAGVIKNGKKTICISFFHYTGIQAQIDFDGRQGKVTTAEDLLRNGFAVSDGGAYYFTAQFDVETDRFDLLSFNGDA